MPTTTDTREKENSTGEATKLAQDLRRYMDESGAIGRGYLSAWTVTAQAGMRTAFDLQNAMVQASRTLLDAGAQANRNWFDQAADSVRKGQETTSKMVAASLDMVESTMPKSRG